MRLVRIRIDRIRFRGNRRQLEGIDDLVASIRDLGLLNPIHVTRKHYLIAGRHRLEACKQLGWKHIPAFIVDTTEEKARLLELDENLVRNELSELQKGLQMWERRMIYESIFPDTATRKPQNEIFTRRASRLSGESRRTIERYCQIGRELRPYEKAINGMELAANKMELVRLASIKDIPTVEAVIDLLKNARAESVTEARKLVELNRNTTLLGYPVISKKAEELKTVQFNFQLLHAQKALIEKALDAARMDKSELSAPSAKNSNANCLTKICAFYLRHYPVQPSSPKREGTQKLSSEGRHTLRQVKGSG